MTADICGSNATGAAGLTGVPSGLLTAMALTESGTTRYGSFKAWPWTINEGGKGSWFATKAEAVAHARQLVASGVRNFDVGCFQLNYHWHGSAFSDVSAMFDPGANAHYAARFLAALHAEFGDWKEASKAYHSRTPELAGIYWTKVAANLRKLGSSLPDSLLAEAPASSQNRAPSGSASRPNAYPFLVAEVRSARLGSLVPIHGGTARPSLFQPVGK
ncbi:transglycosylase-like protein with SLT domain [Aliiruegeria haliotis]|uniref:Transglycosylase-like protein with SLT domain n=1 Tax=Aliiruegeria haliotis TaxID=1280846 RepID=A0A2T0RPF6_9RHOB|nr:transglycosylase SLT domain-containing protein [Aliiruegeria haliotis]PRY23022.1 transglycosylase-like protein with SLT domain [Aliiruegeria haliotis]